MNPSINLDQVGRFSVGKVDGKRIRVFTTTDRTGHLRVGASKRFSRVEAFENATKFPTITPRPGESALTALLRAKGFPVQDNSTIDDNTAALIGAELSQST